MELVYKAIEIKDSTLDLLQELITSEKWGQFPCYLLVSEELAEKDHKILLNVLEKMISRMGLSAKYPFPTYFISPYNLKSELVPILKGREFLPRLYAKKHKEADSSKQRELQRRIITMTKKVSNLSPEVKVPQLKLLIKQSKELYSKAKQYDFLRQIEEQIGRR